MHFRLGFTSVNAPERVVLATWEIRSKTSMERAVWKTWPVMWISRKSSEWWSSSAHFYRTDIPSSQHRICRSCSNYPLSPIAVPLTVTPEQLLDLDPGEAQVSLVVDTAAGSCYNVREDVCNYGHFFHSRETAMRWQAAHPHALILSVEEAYQVGKLVEGYHARK